MPHFPNSPEASLGRSDSKNPATTCKGITGKGRPCRRPIASSSANSPAASPDRHGVLAILHHVGGSSQDAAAYYCYNHKSQAPTGSTITDTGKLDLKNRSSIDTLAERLGILNVEEETPTKPKKKRQNAPGGTPIKRNTLPQQWQEVPGPFLSVPNGSAHTSSSSSPRPKPTQQVVRPRTREYNFSCFCCGSKKDNPPPAPRPVNMAQRPGNVAAIPAHAMMPSRPSQTAVLNSWIPSTVAPATHARLLTELSKPLSPQDKDTGYVYMFWETPSSTPQPTPELARSLLQGAWNNRDQLGSDARQARDDLLQDPWNAAKNIGAGMRRTSDAVRSASQSDCLEVKIGRADNVQKRMDQWTRQCGKHITLLRYYPYTSDSGNSPAASPRRGKNVIRPEPGQTPAGPNHPGPVPNCARVERMIHLELADKRIKKSCAACGREHREWFEIEATKEGVQKVDEVIRRWIRWGEARAAEERANQA